MTNRTKKIKGIKKKKNYKLYVKKMEQITFLFLGGGDKRKGDFYAKIWQNVEDSHLWLKDFTAYIRI